MAVFTKVEGSNLRTHLYKRSVLKLFSPDLLIKQGIRLMNLLVGRGIKLPSMLTEYCHNSSMITICV